MINHRDRQKGRVRVRKRNDFFCILWISPFMNTKANQRLNKEPY